VDNSWYGGRHSGKCKPLHDRCVMLEQHLTHSSMWHVLKQVFFWQCIVCTYVYCKYDDSICIVHLQDCLVFWFGFALSQRLENVVVIVI